MLECYGLNGGKASDWLRLSRQQETRTHSCGCLQQLEQVYHLEAQAIAQAGWQCLKAGRHVLNQGDPIRQVDARDIGREASLRSCTPSGRGDH